MRKPTWSMTKIHPNPGQAHTRNRCLRYNTNSTSSTCRTNIND